MSEKVKVSREVAEAIENIRCFIPEYGYTATIRQFEKKDKVDSNFVKCRKFFNEDATKFIRALLGEYEVAETPEDIILRDFLIEKKFSKERYGDASIRSQGYVSGIRETLNTLGIKIKGIND